MDLGVVGEKIRKRRVKRVLQFQEPFEELFGLVDLLLRQLRLLLCSCRAAEPGSGLSCASVRRAITRKPPAAAERNLR